MWGAQLVLQCRYSGVHGVHGLNEYSTGAGSMHGVHGMQRRSPSVGQVQGAHSATQVWGPYMGCMECRERPIRKEHMGTCKAGAGTLHGAQGTHGVHGEAHLQLRCGEPLVQSRCGECTWGTWRCIKRGAMRGPSAAQVRGAPSARQVWGVCMRYME